MKASGGIPLVMAGSGEHSHQTDAEYQRENRRVYDPTWANARAFLDYLDQHKMLQKNIDLAGMGQFIICAGKLAIADLHVVERSWQLKSMQAIMKAGKEPIGNRHSRRTEPAPPPKSTELDFALEMLSIMPHTIQARIEGAAKVWCSLNQDGLATQASDITLKHGMVIPGEWHAVGILDAKPEYYTEDAPAVNFLDPNELALKMLSLIAPITRTMLGRPNTYYGITPLLIFREIAG